MLDQTDSEKVRDIAVSLLWTDIVDAGFLFLASHPFTDSWLTCADNHKMIDLHDPSGLKVWRESKEKTIRNVPLLVIMCLICRPYRMTFLKYAAPFLSAADIGSMLREAWKSTENISGDINVTREEMVELYHIADKKTLMTPTELHKYNILQPIFRVFRGVTDFNKDRTKAMSWTSSIKTAKWFAKRYDSTGEIWALDITNEDVLAVFEDEHEIVVKPEAIKKIRRFTLWV